MTKMEWTALVFALCLLVTETHTDRSTIMVIERSFGPLYSVVKSTHTVCIYTTTMGMQV